MLGSSQSMFFRSAQVSAQWDTWMFHHEGVYYLYYLITEQSGGEGFGVATSEDGVTWHDHGWALHASDEMVVYLGTGAVWPNPQPIPGHKFICNYSEWRRDGEDITQNILFAHSDDLIHWHKYGDERLFAVDTRHYERLGRWDCIYPLLRPEGGYYGYWTATPQGRVGFGFGQSADGVNWEALPAPVLDWGDETSPESMEAGAVELIGGRYYAMTGQPSVLRMCTMVADAPDGPFVAASRNYCLLGNRGDHKHTYFARFVRTPDGILANHHAISRLKNEHGRPVCSFAPLKRARVDGEGTLWLRYWAGNEALKRRALSPSWRDLGNGTRLTSEAVDTEPGLVLEGVLRLPTSDETDAPVLYVGQRDGQGTVIAVCPGGVTQFGQANLSADGRLEAFVIEDIMAREWPFGQTVTFRLLLKGSLLEFYLDDLYIQSYSLVGDATGMIGLGGGDAIQVTGVWQA